MHNYKINEIIEEFENKDILLPIEIVPQSSHYNNLRKLLSPSNWQLLREKNIPELNNKCMICGGASPKRSLDLHEVWDYDIHTGEQKLIRLEGLCIYCHEVKHYYLAKIKGKYSRARNRLKRINKWDDFTTDRYEIFTHYNYVERSKIKWRLNVDLIENYNMKIISTKKR